MALSVITFQPFRHGNPTGNRPTLAQRARMGHPRSAPSRLRLSFRIVSSRVWSTKQSRKDGPPAKIVGGTPKAQDFILLRELSHLMNVLQPDMNKQRKVDQNEKLLEENCKKLIKAMGKI
jgi:hypothetical protein